MLLDCTPAELDGRDRVRYAPPRWLAASLNDNFTPFASIIVTRQ